MQACRLAGLHSPACGGGVFERVPRCCSVRVDLPAPPSLLDPVANDKLVPSCNGNGNGNMCVCKTHQHRCTPVGMASNHRERDGGGRETDRQTERETEKETQRETERDREDTAGVSSYHLNQSIRTKQPNSVLSSTPSNNMGNGGPVCISASLLPCTLHPRRALTVSSPPQTGSAACATCDDVINQGCTRSTQGTVLTS